MKNSYDSSWWRSWASTCILTQPLYQLFPFTMDNGGKTKALIVMYTHFLPINVSENRYLLKLRSLKPTTTTTNQHYNFRLALLFIKSQYWVNYLSYNFIYEYQSHYYKLSEKFRGGWLLFSTIFSLEKSKLRYALGLFVSWSSTISTILKR